MSLSLFTSKTEQRPQFALVFHGTHSTNCDTVTAHQIVHGEIGIGKYVSAGSVLEMVRGALPEKTSLSTQSIIDPRLLLESHDWIVWYEPSRFRPLYLKAANKPVVRNVRMPSLVFIADKHAASLRIFAIPANTRPSRGTKLFHAPLPNIAADGSLCFGDARMPEERSGNTLDAMADCFFGCNGTHPNHNFTLRSEKRVSEAQLHRFWKQKALSGLSVKVSEMQPYTVTSGHKTVQQTVGGLIDDL